MTKIELDLSCNTQLRCTECGCQNFRICMDCNEETNEVSAMIVNNVECSNCHALYQVNLVREGNLAGRNFPPAPSELQAPAEAGKDVA